MGSATSLTSIGAKQHPWSVGLTFLVCKMRTSPPAHSLPSATRRMQDVQNQKLGTGWALVSSPVSLTAEGEGGSSDEMLFKASPSRAHWGTKESQRHMGWLHLVAGRYHLPQF